MSSNNYGLPLREEEQADSTEEEIYQVKGSEEESADSPQPEEPTSNPHKRTTDEAELDKQKKDREADNNKTGTSKQPKTDKN
ncbi:hypothetical protein SARC_05362 [Sphaeroforma arctica JP610]|uniref:Uncharacterized protein n=1 Tax=Sphaeroforma arctica JP610 TaxID=667725 RepID=A0A0L0FZR5_9EUKA|nr:hypothetical protein SARC_05362 [Sphaeroforma arctica JP610]KNC82347.1 hypothetical protein SARC_05362 [Sphaeroforma arctica JP610]|eukprot:XP_014156249.1 hypothetical protein SARC_05362 [Sphaeroforma arctica JP610]